MTLGDYVASLPHGERQKFRKLLAEAHACSVSLVRKWECDPPPGNWPVAKVRAMSRRHPSDLKAISITETLTSMVVTRNDLRPECWPDGVMSE